MLGLQVQMLNRFVHRKFQFPGRVGLALLLFVLNSGSAWAQSWSWTYDTIDLPARFPSLVVDAKSNLHISYADDSGSLKYGFRPAGSTHWFTMFLDKQLGAFTTRLAVDANNNPHICYTPGMIKYAFWDGQQWKIQQIAKEGGEVGYTCSIVIAKDGAPNLTWYQLTGPNLLHIKYAALKDGAWMARTLDFDHETGKWSSMLLDSQDHPLIAYSAWVNGELRVAHWNGKQWDFTTVDSRTRSPGEYNIGEGNSLTFDSKGLAHIGYYSERTMKYAHQTDKGWQVETIDQVNWLGSWAQFRSSIVLDQHNRPHVCYEDTGILKHAYWDGKQWRIQVLARSGMEIFRFASMAIDRDDTVYVAFRDPADNTLTLATGHPASAQPDSQAKKEEKQAAPQKEQ